MVKALPGLLHPLCPRLLLVGAALCRGPPIVLAADPAPAPGLQGLYGPASPASRATSWATVPALGAPASLAAFQFLEHAYFLLALESSHTLSSLPGTFSSSFFPPLIPAYPLEFSSDTASSGRYLPGCEVSPSDTFPVPQTSPRKASSQLAPYQAGGSVRPGITYLLLIDLSSSRQMLGTQ